MSDLYTPAEDQQGDNAQYIEAAFHALRANRPDVALRYLVQGLGSSAYGELLRATAHDASARWSGGDLTTLAAVVSATLQAGDTDGR